jgi:predicted GNAT family acetyltransferase
MQVDDNPAESRYEACDESTLLGFAEYRILDNRFWLIHTEIADVHRGHGVGAQLARSALDDLRAKDLLIVPTCPFIAGWIRRHPEYDDMIDHETLSAYKRERFETSRSRASDRSRDLPCSHVRTDLHETPVPVPADGCDECIEMGRRDWVHLRMCQACGHIGCCDDSPGQHGSLHAVSGDHPLVRSYEPGEDWWYCYVDVVTFQVEGAPPAPSYS